MDIAMWWPRLPVETRRWLVANNGDTVTGAVLADIAAAGGPHVSDGWWSQPEGDEGPSMPDEATDWIEATANLEQPAD